MIVAFLRHASTAWNVEGRMQGRRDVPLSAAGRIEIDRWRLPAGLDSRAQWFASPLARSVETATRVAGRPPRAEPALIEMDWGVWEGYRLDELRERFGPEFARQEAAGLDFCAPGGERPRDVVARVTRWLASLTDTGCPVIAVTHNGVLRALLSAATGWDMTGKPPIKLRPATLHRFSVEKAGEARRPLRLIPVEWNVPLAAVSATRSTALSATPP